MKRCLRGKRKGKRKYNKYLRFLGVNTAGLKSKLTSFKKVLTDLQPSVFFAQETKFREEGNIKLGNDYVIYELVRKNGGGGGLALGCLKELNPCWISDGGDKVEVLSVDIFLKSMKIRCCVAYGPQENDNVEKKEMFWEYLDREVEEARKSGAGFVLQFDGNLWAGNHLIPGDPRPQNKNGNYFEQFLNRNPRLTIVNSLSECEGLITRSRVKNGVLEESILDFFIVCSAVLPFVTKMVIDEKKNHILTNYKSAKITGRAVDSDHYTQYLDINIKIVNEKPEKQEIFNFRDSESQELFRTITSETNEFTNCFNGKSTLIEKIENWRQILNSYCTRAFKKIRINHKKLKPPDKKISELINKRNEMIVKGCVCGKKFGLQSEVQKHKGENTYKSKKGFNFHVKNHTKGEEFVCQECGKQFIRGEIFESHMKQHNLKVLKNSQHKNKEPIKCKECGKTLSSYQDLNNHRRIHIRAHVFKCEICEKEITSLDIAIAEEEALQNREKILKQFNCFSENPERIEMQKMWKLLKNICPKVKRILPSALRNHQGKIVSSKNDIKNLLAKEFKNRLRPRPYRQDLLTTKLRRKKLFALKLKMAEMNKSKPWTKEDLEKALNDLKRNKSRDGDGLVNEIFKNEIIGTNLKDSLLILCNSLKKENMISKFMNHANITTVPKKGSKLELKNQRGIFRVSVIRSILMRLIYNAKYKEIDQNISDGQMGARKGKGCKSNIWIINGIIHETLNSKKNKPIVLQIYDYAQMFDSINLQEALCDIFDYGLNDDNLSLILKANQEVHMAVKTTWGTTDRQIIKNSVLQGDTFGSLLASVQVDSIAQEVEKAGVGYMYKKELPINILGLVDDIVGVTEAGHKAQMMNIILNTKSAEKCLQFGAHKCKVMVIGKKIENVRNNTLYVDSWQEEYIVNEENFESELNEEYIGQIAIEEVKAQKYLGFIISSDGNNLENIKAIEKKSIGVIRTIMTKLDKLKLRQYFFECSKIFMNVILRGSILYAGECYYNLTENQLRRIEKIEEKYMRKIFQTGRGCPNVQMYLEYGQWPARFELKKMRCLFLKKILKEKKSSQIYRFFELQLKNPIKGDWVSTCLNDLSELEIKETLEEINEMSAYRFKKLLKSKIEIKALEYLQRKRGSKGKEIRYTKLEMSEYLLPFNSKLNIEKKRRLFEIKNRMYK